MGVQSTMPLMPSAPHQLAPHRPWCTGEHQAGETCVSGIAQIPDMPLHVWAKQQHGNPDTLEIVIDGGTETLVIQVPTDGTI